MSLTSNVTEKANLLWSIAEKLTGSYKPHEYGLVILPLTVIRRFDCILEPTHKDVLEKAKQIEKMPDAIKQVQFQQITKHPFYNTSNFTLKDVVANPNQVNKNFENYLNGFSANIRDEIIAKFNFGEQLKRLKDKDLLLIVLQEFVTEKADFSPDKISNIEMGYIFEELIRRFSEAHNEDAGQHYTPREVIELMTELLFIDDEDIQNKKECSKSIYDPACGTGGMLSVASEYIEKRNLPVTLESYGQEINDETYAICKADILIKSKDGKQAENIRNGNTLSDDKFGGLTFDYILSNPPFGREWKNEKTKVEQEADLGDKGRFGPGLPKISDSQMLFMLNIIAKMDKQNGKAAVIHNGSPLFTGDAGSGTSNIRKYILENDLLDAIIALPNDIFYNTGIATYIWIFNRRKAENRKGKIQLINANSLFEKRRKALGNKRNDISEENIKQIVGLYSKYKKNDLSMIFDTKDFGYTTITVERPLKDENGKLVLKNGKKQPDSSLRDTENVPLKEDIQEYFKREVLPFVPDAWIDEKKNVIGYEIPFTRYFYKYEAPKPSAEIMDEIKLLEKDLMTSLSQIMGE
ncbi:MAG: type I restriction-modification system subunit M [Treponema sp.]|uniref:type I restriction-modification system subunit M n=1 Tax=Treponema sp. TaxID=166 RepID=UPI00298EBB40|nr:class I SAM-dependent DNA methyltransferase [Treponema sp.]MCQ2602079.1 type I restriction-modification system subunit M [Treponema sp.]